MVAAATFPESYSNGYLGRTLRMPLEGVTSSSSATSPDTEDSFLLFFRNSLQEARQFVIHGTFKRLRLLMTY